ncbi:MAG: class II aldolase/adducin family protein [Desulfobulbus oligotrophicus]|jgi:L-fuculose-phosphate aldolase|nr:class II aldolase/adducin family protein [Desulfobulbus oligotrophicus]
MIAPDLRKQILTTALAMNERGLNQGSSGNISARHGHGLLITPSALPYEQCTPDDVVWIDGEDKVHGMRKPSSEWRMHANIYRSFPQAGAILHAHSMYCTALACLERSIPAFHYMIAVAGGDSIRCAPYALFGSDELSAGAVSALHGRSAALLAHHGMVCFAVDLEKVLALAVEVETLAHIYLQTLQVAGEPPLLSRAEMDAVLERFKGYKP